MPFSYHYYLTYFLRLPWSWNNHTLHCTKSHLHKVSSYLPDEALSKHNIRMRWSKQQRPTLIHVKKYAASLDTALSSSCAGCLTWSSTSIKWPFLQKHKLARVFSCCCRRGWGRGGEEETTAQLLQPLRIWFTTFNLGSFSTLNWK